MVDTRQPAAHRKSPSFLSSFRLFRSGPSPPRFPTAFLARGHAAGTLGNPPSPLSTTSPTLSPTSLFSHQDSSLLASSTLSANFSDSGTSPPSVPPKTYFPTHRMKLARKVRKFSRIAAADDHPQGRRIGDMLEDPYSLMTMPPAVVSSPSSSPSRSTFTESHLQLPSSSLKRAATMRSSTDVPAQGAQGIQRARSLAALQPKLTVSHSPSPRRSPVSPIIFARPNGSHSSLSETSSALYSESCVPSRSPSLLRSEIKEVDDESPFSEAPAADAVSGSGAHSPGAQGDDVYLQHAMGSNSTTSLAERASGSQTSGQRGSSSGAPRVRLRPASPPPAASSSRAPSPSPTPHLQPRSPLLSRLATAPPSRSPSPTPSSYPSAIPTHLRDAERSRIDLPLRTASLRRVMRPRTPTKRRLSLDLRSFSPEPVKGARLKKGKSALVSSSRKSAEEERKRSTDGMEDALDDETLRVAGSLSDKERALYLKRTRKILQLFGDKPPKEFFQVTQATRPGDDTLDAIDTISILTTVSENRRDSRATFTSLTSSTISLTVHRRVRDSVQSISEPSSPLAFTGSELPEDKKQSQEQEKRKSQSSAQDAIEEHAEASSHTEPESSGAARKSESSFEEGDLPPLPLSPIQPIHQPRPKPSIQSISAASTTSHTRTLSFHSQAPLNPHGHAHEPEPPLPAPPRTPPPFTNTIARPDAPAAPGPARAQSPAPPEEFRARRRRAAKLSRFFGVAPHDLAGALAPAPQSPTLSSYKRSTLMPRPHTSQGHARAPSTTVEVQTEVPRAFRIGRPEKKAVQEEDMADILNQLRRMR